MAFEQKLFNIELFEHASQGKTRQTSSHDQNFGAHGSGFLEMLGTGETNL